MKNNIDQLWHTIEEARDNYFVSYAPAGKCRYLAMVVLTYPAKIPSYRIIAKAIEDELRYWMSRFNVPIMATAESASEEAIEFGEEFKDGFLFGHIKENNELDLNWGPISDDSIPEILKTPEHRNKEYQDVPYTSKSQIIENQKQHKRIVQTGKGLVLFWFVVIPAFIAVVGYFNWFYVGLIAMIYSLFKALIEALRIQGYVKESRYDEQKSDEEREKEHHHYHCKRNPDSFARLMAENYKREDELKALEKFDTLKKKQQVDRQKN